MNQVIGNERPLRFAVGRELGRGATGQVLHAILLDEFEGHAAGSELAVKYLHSDLESDPSATSAFRRESRAALTVQHPGLVRAIAYGRDERGSYLAMEYVPGRTLGDVLDNDGPLPEPAVRSVAHQVASALAALHAHGYVHGDVKPDNVRLDSEGRAVLVDLGFSESVGSGSASAAHGTPLYLAPERIRGAKSAPASDVFALGIVLYEVATGAHPFAHSDSEQVAVLEALVNASFDVPSSRVPDLSPFFDAALAGAVARVPEQRPSADELSTRFAQGEASKWWRDRIEFGHVERRSGTRELAPFVGRESELRELSRLAESATERDAVVRLVGPSGIGKTRLAHEFALRRKAESSAQMFLYGRAHQMRDGRPCQPILRMLQRYLGLPKNSAPDEREREHLATLIPPGSVTTLMRALDPRFDGATPVSVPVALSEWLRAVATGGALLFLDDLQHADLGTIRVLGAALASRPTSPSLWLLSHNEELPARHVAELGELLERVAPETIRLAPLDEASVGQLVSELFEHATPRLRLADALWEKTQGHPGLTSEILRGLIQRGDAAQSDVEPGRYALLAPPESLPLPDSEKRAIAQAFRALPESARQWLGRLSVVRSRIETEFLIHAFPPAERAEVDAILARLVRSGWLVSARTRYRFARPAARDAIYRSLPSSRREQLHAQVARAMKPRSGEPISLADAVQRAFHLHAAKSHAEYLRLCRPLIDRLLKRGLPQRVLSLAKWGLEAMDALSNADARRSIELLEAAADAADRLGERREQRHLLDRISEIEFDEDDVISMGRAYLLHGRYAVSTGSYGLARGWLDNAVRIFRSAGLHDFESDALSRLAFAQAHVGELEEAKRLAQSALERSSDPVRRAAANLARGNVDILVDRLEPALRCSDRALRLLRTAKDSDTGEAAASAHLLRARVYRSSGRPVRALGAARRALEIARRSGERRLETECRARVGSLLLPIDRVEEAEASLREAWLSATEIEDRRSQALCALFLGILLVEDDRTDAERWVAKATRLAGEVGLNRLQALSLAVEARLDLLEGRQERARTAIERAVFLVEQFGSELLDRVVIEGTHALLLAATEDQERAKEVRQGLERRLRREVSRVASPVLRKRRREALARLLDAVLSTSGPIYPREARPAPAPRDGSTTR